MVNSITAFLERMFVSENKLIRNFAFRWHSKDLVKDVERFEKEWKELLKLLKENHINDLIQLEDHLLSYLTSAEKNAESMFMNMNQTAKDIIQELFEVQKYIQKIEAVSDKQPNNKPLTIFFKAWVKLDRKTSDYFDATLREAYKRLLQVSDAAHNSFLGSGKQTVMESLMTTMKDKGHIFDKFLFTRAFRTAKKNQFSSKSKLREIRKIVHSAYGQINKKVSKFDIQKLLKAVDTFYDLVKSAINYENKVVQREIIYLFIILEDAQMFDNLEVQVINNRQIPRMIGEKVRIELKNIERELHNLAEREKSTEISNINKLKAVA